MEEYSLVSDVEGKIEVHCFCVLLVQGRGLEGINRFPKFP